MRLYFPQFSSGASTQFPIKKRRITRTIDNRCLDGRSIRLADPGAGSLEWHMALEGLSDSDLNVVQQFFQSVEGRLTGFVFLDPTDNLIAWSEKLDEPVWEKPALLQITDAIKDPLGYSRASRLVNSSAGVLPLEQTLSAPGWYQYCFSVYVRSQQSAAIVLRRRTASGDQIGSHNVDPEWTRFSLSGKPDTTDESVTFGLEIASNSSVDVFGLQVEAQVGASTYKKTAALGGIYTDARLLEDAFTFTTTAPDRHRCVLKIAFQEHA